MGQDTHRRDVVHAVRRDVALLVLVEPVQGEPPARHIVHPTSGLIAGICRDRVPILQPVAQRRWGKLTLVTVGYRGGGKSTGA